LEKGGEGQSPESFRVSRKERRREGKDFVHLLHADRRKFAGGRKRESRSSRLLEVEIKKKEGATVSSSRMEEDCPPPPIIRQVALEGKKKKGGPIFHTSPICGVCENVRPEKNALALRVSP